EGIRMKRQLLIVSGLALTLTSWSLRAQAQTVAAGPYYATPSWDQTIPCTASTNCSRFVVLSNFSNQAVLDRDTGLGWQPAPQLGLSSKAIDAASLCFTQPIAGRMGWRLPTVSEVGSLLQGGLSGFPFPSLDTSLPAGHPFSVPSNAVFWTSTPSTSSP